MHYKKALEQEPNNEVLMTNMKKLERAAAAKHWYTVVRKPLYELLYHFKIATLKQIVYNYSYGIALFSRLHISSLTEMIYIIKIPH